MKKKSGVDLFEGYLPPKEKPKPEWDVNELLGPPPSRYYRRMAFYEKLRKEEEKKNAQF
jgi:hypothetical protein